MGQVSDIQMQSGAMEVLACGLQVHHAANGRDTSVHSIFSLTGVVRLAVALCPQNLTLSRASSPAFG